MKKYLAKANEAVSEMFDHFLERMIEHIQNEEELSYDVKDYDDNYIHENLRQEDYSLIEAANLIEELSAYEETDSGLWRVRNPKVAIKAMAAYTFGNAVTHLFQEKVKKINEKFSNIDSIDEKVCLLKIYVFLSNYMPDEEPAKTVAEQTLLTLWNNDIPQILVMLDAFEEIDYHLYFVKEIRELIKRIRTEELLS